MARVERPQADVRERSDGPQSRDGQSFRPSSFASTPIKVIVHFYGTGTRQMYLARKLAILRLWCFILTRIWLYSLAPAQRRRLLMRYRELTDAAFGGLYHVDVQVGPMLWTWGPISGCSLKPVGSRTVQPLRSQTIPIDALPMSGGEWVGTPNVSPLKCILFTLGCPLVREQPTCSIMTARLLGIRRRCRRPADVEAAIMAGDFNGY